VEFNVKFGAHVSFSSGALCVRPENGWPCARSFSIVGSGHLKTVGMKLAALWNTILSVQSLTGSNENTLLLQLSLVGLHIIIFEVFSNVAFRTHY